MPKILAHCLWILLVSTATPGCGQGESKPGIEAAPAASSVQVERNHRNAIYAQLGIARPYTGKLTSLASLNIRDAKLERILEPVAYPWAFEFLSPQELLVTLHRGELLRIDLATGAMQSVTGLPTISAGSDQIGLMDIALHPQFARNQRIYISYARANPKAPQYYQTEVATGILSGTTLTRVERLINSEHFGWAPSNFGGALEFDNRGFLFISMGDRGDDLLSQHTDRLEGKILRINDDGSIPADNPFVGRPQYDPRIYAIGVRNAQGLYFDHETGRLFASEHGPLGGDEVNIIHAGKNYGWPLISYGNNYATSEQVGAGSHQKGLEQPLFYFLPSIAVSRLLIYRGTMFPEWQGDILLGALKAQHVHKLDLDGNQVRSSRQLLTEINSRIRDLKVAHDGSLFVLSQSRGLYRLSRQTPPRQTTAVSAQANDEHPGKLRYEMVCAGCHDQGAMEAPVLGDAEQWATIAKQPNSLTYDRVFNGYGNMPERGLCHTCTDDQLQEIVAYMLASASTPTKQPANQAPAN